MQIKAKRIDRLEDKVKDFKNKIVSKNEYLDGGSIEYIY